MSAKKPTGEKTQKTRPKKGDPVEIPIPEKSQIMADFEKIATPDQDDDEDAANGEAAR